MNEALPERDAHELRRFLRERRGAIRPDQVGLPNVANRRVAGLRREEVAELAQVSVVWYTRFEMGRAQLSVSALERVADALRLGGTERRRLFDLARPDLAEVSARNVRDLYTGLGTGFDGLRDLSRSCAAASSVEEIADAAVRAMHGIAGEGTVSYMREHRVAVGDLPIVSACGSGAEALVGNSVPCASVAYAMRHFVDGRGFGEVDLRRSPSADVRSRVDLLGVQSYHSQPIMGRDGLDSILGIALREPRPPSRGRSADSKPRPRSLSYRFGDERSRKHALRQARQAGSGGLAAE